MKFEQKTLKLYSYDLCHDFEIAMCDVLEAGIADSWNKWHKFISENHSIFYKNIVDKARKNNREFDFKTFNAFKINLDFSDYTNLIIYLASNGNSHFAKFFIEKKNKLLLPKAVSDAYWLRNLQAHAQGKTIYLDDIKAFLTGSILVSKILNISSLIIKYNKILKDIESDIMDSKYYTDQIYSPISHNLPLPEYNKWYGLVGRQTDKDFILKDLVSGHNRIIAITGGGGIGKSALAIDIGYELTKPEYGNFKTIIWATSKNNFLDSSGIKDYNPEDYYKNSYKDFLNQIITAFWQEVLYPDIDLITEDILENDINEILSYNSRILFIIDNVENIDDSRILDFIKNKILPPNYCLITSRKGLGEINKIYQLKQLNDDEAKLLFENFCKLYNIDISGIKKTLKNLVKKTNNYPLAIKWCLELVANRKMELTLAFDELDKNDNALVEFIFQKVYKDLSKPSKTLLKVISMYKETPDRNIVAYLAGIVNENVLADSIAELEQYSLITQERKESITGIIEIISILPLALSYIKNIKDENSDIKIEIEKKIIEVEDDISKVQDDTSKYYRPAQKLAQSKLLQAYKIAAFQNKSKTNAIDSLIKESEKLAPRFHLVPFFKGMIEMCNKDYVYSEVKELFESAIGLNTEDPKLLFEYGNLIKKHKPKAYRDYAKSFMKAFELSNDAKYGIEAAEIYYEMEEYNTVLNIVKNIEENNPIFFKDLGHKIWLSNTYIKLAEQSLEEDNTLFKNYLDDCGNLIDGEDDTQNKEFRILKAKYYSLRCFYYIGNKQKEESNAFLTLSKGILSSENIIDSTLEYKEITWYNLVNEILLNGKDELKLAKLNSELKLVYKNKLPTKFSKLLKKIRWL